MRTHKNITDSQGNTIRICGCNRWQKIHMSFNKETEEYDSYVHHYGRNYNLNEFMATRTNFAISNVPKWMQKYDGYTPDSFFSGILIKLSDDCEAAKVFTYIS